MEQKFYFTYGSEGQPYEGGWTEVIAQDEHIARKLFMLAHPTESGLLPCCTCYTEKEFENTVMYARGENLGYGCWERISFNVKKVCPRCHREYDGYPALSRYDNKTPICSECGTEEALNDFLASRH